MVLSLPPRLGPLRLVFDARSRACGVGPFADDGRSLALRVGKAGRGVGPDRFAVLALVGLPARGFEHLAFFRILHLTYFLSRAAPVFSSFSSMVAASSRDRSFLAFLRRRRRT